MGEHEGWAEPSGLLPNGLLPSAGPLIRVLDSEKWLKAEERTEELITCIQPNQPSEERRNAVANYVQRLIMKCFPCQVFTFGSVPLKTYLPDGDIDLTAFSNNQTLKDTWANQVRDMLESEEKNENAEFHVKEVQYIQAEVKIIKCLVENIVVDISFNQLGGLCTLCFLEEVDHLINQNHLFKRSIILIKAWCYYESRILGAHHGLISTYALETLVLYIFHVFNNSFSGPLEVLYHFLEFFSNFDWDSFCLSLWGPVPISSLPDVNAEPPRKDSGELLLSKSFLDSCSSAYAVIPGGQENQGQPFVSKHFNVIDPLRINNNLGRSVSKGNFFRIRSAFSFGAKKLARLLDCPKENVVFEVNQFFMNTWDRHGSGHRPDAPNIDLWHPRLSTQDHLPGSENRENNLNSKKLNDKSYARETEVDSPIASRAQSQKNYVNPNNLRSSDQIVGSFGSNQVLNTDKSQRFLKSDQMVNDIQGRILFARTRSSPELTDTNSSVSSRGRRNRSPESGKNQDTPARVDGNRRKNIGSENLASHSRQSSTDDQSVDASAEKNIGSNYYHRDSGAGAMSEELSSVTGTHGMHQEEQDLVNLMASCNFQSFNGQVQMPFNLGSGHLPFSLPPSVVASLGYPQRNFTGMAPPNIPMIDPSFSNMQFPHLVSPPFTHYFPGIGMNSNSENSIEPGNKSYASTEIQSGESDRDFWQEPDVGPTGRLGPENENIENLRLDDKFVPSFQGSGSGNSLRVQQKFVEEGRGSFKEDHPDNLQYQDLGGNEVYADERTESSRFSSSARSSSMRSKTSSESSWDGSSAKVSKSAREKWGKKTVPAEPSTVYAKSKGMSKHVATRATEEDERDWNSLSSTDTGIAERGLGPQSVAPLKHHIPGYESAESSGTDSMIPISPMLLGPGSRQSVMDNSGVPFTFYPTGPPVPFLTMLPVYNIPPETQASEDSTSHLSREDGLDNGDSDQNFHSSEGRDRLEDFRSSSVETTLVHKSDILNSDFTSHWQNLQFGRFCQNPRYHGPVVYSSPVMVPPMYLQGGPGRPLSGNTNVFTQLVNYGPRLVPVTPLQSVSNRPSSGYQRYVDDMPSYRSGTGTYLPNPKVSVRDRHSSLTRRGSFNYDRSDHHSDREGNWNTNSRSRAAGRSHGRSQTDKSSPRMDRLASGESRADRPWTSFRQDSIPSYQSPNGPSRSNPSQSGLHNVAYGMYPLPAMNGNGVSSNGQTVPSVVMLYPFDHNANHGSHSERLEFGSLGPVFFSDSNEQSQSQSSEGNQAMGAFEEQRYHGGSVQRSSPDQPSSPHLHRRV